MLKAKLFVEIDFQKQRKSPCELCGRQFEEHFQPTAYADPNLAAHWCPNLHGRGFTSRSFKRPKPAHPEKL
jgi:hypothetical protein